MSIPGHAIANSYDKAGRLLSTTAGGRTLSYLYDAASNRTRITHPDGVYFTYDYDALGRVTAVKENGAVSLASYSYDDLSRRTVATLGNGTTTSYGYETDGALDALTNNMAGTAQDITFGFDYNRVNQITVKTTSNPLYDWTALFDRSVASSHNGLNQLTQVQDGGLSAAIAHDPNGNLTGDGVWAYSYDAGNRLKTATKPGVSASYSYDGLGRRVSKTGTGVAATWYLTDGAAMVAEYAAATGTAPLRRYVHGPGVDEPIVVYDGATTTTKRWFYSNWQGSIIAEANAAGTVTSTYRYGPYGEPDALTGAMFRYTGQLLDAETGLYYYKARYYSPQLGRFLQTDPIGYEDDQNLYAYVGGDPVNLVDPSGLCAIQDGVIVDCKVNLPQGDLTKAQQQQVDNLVARIVEVGEAIQNSDDSELQEGLKNITEINITFEEGPRGQTAQNDDDKVTFFDSSLQGETPRQRDHQRLVAAHEITHSSPLFRRAMTQAFEKDGFERGSNVFFQEQRTDRRAFIFGRDHKLFESGPISLGDLRA